MSNHWLRQILGKDTTSAFVPNRVDHVACCCCLSYCVIFCRVWTRDYSFMNTQSWYLHSSGVVQHVQAMDRGCQPVSAQERKLTGMLSADPKARAEDSTTHILAAASSAASAWPFTLVCRAVCLSGAIHVLQFWQANPVFHNWTLVYVPYCDGTSFSGDAVVSCSACWERLKCLRRLAGPDTKIFQACQQFHTPRIGR